MAAAPSTGIASGQVACWQDGLTNLACCSLRPGGREPGSCRPPREAAAISTPVLLQLDQPAVHHADLGTVDRDVLQDEQPHVLDDARLLDVVEPAMLEPDRPDRVLRVAAQVERARTASRGEAGHVDVADDRPVRAASTLLVEVVDQHDTVGHARYLDISHIDLLDHTAAVGIGFDPYRDLEFRAFHQQVLGKDVVHTAGFLAADRESAVAVLHVAVADDDVLAREVAGDAVATAARLERDAVVAGVERAAFDQHVVAALRIAAVV